MKHLIKTIFGLSIAALLTVFIACPQPAGPGGAANSGSPSSPQTPPPKTPVEKALGELAVSPVQVYKDMNKVNLPTATSVTDVTITWTAEPAGYINDDESSPDFGNVLKHETETTEVTLTATATKDGETKIKTFKITIHPATVEPDAQAFADSLLCPSSVSQDFTLPQSISGYPTAAITWRSADENIIKIENGSDIKGVVVGYDLIDRTVKLTATVHYNSGTGTKDFNVTVEHFANKIKREDSNYIKEYEFTGTELTFTRTDKHTNKIDKGYKYAYTDVNPESKTAVFTKTAKYDEHEKKWVTSQFPSRCYIYSFAGSGTNLRFNTNLPYDSGKPWYEQEGGYDFQNTSVPYPAPAGTIMFIYFRVNKSGANTYSAYIAIHKADGSGHSPQCDNRSSKVPFSPPNSPMTATLVEHGNPSNQLNVEITNINVSSDGLTMNADIKIDSGAFESYELKFRGNSLPLY